MEQLRFFVFNLHQFFFGFNLLVFLFIAWNDQKNKKNQTWNLSRFSRGQVAALAFLAIVMVVGLFFYIYETTGVDAVVISVELSMLVVLSLYRPKFGLAFLLFLLTARPWEAYENEVMMSLPRDMSFLVMISFAMHAIFKRDFYFKWNRASTFLSFFVIWVFITSLVYGTTSDFTKIFIQPIILFFLFIF